jgi:hypothetical protein
MVSAGSNVLWVAGACFTLLSLAFAGMLWLTGVGIQTGIRDNHAEMRWRLRLRSFLLLALMAAVFTCGAHGLSSKLLRVDFTGMQFSRAGCEGDAECRKTGVKELFVVGDTATQADLVLPSRSASTTPHRIAAIIDDHGTIRLNAKPYSLPDGSLRTVGYSTGGSKTIAGASCRKRLKSTFCRLDDTSAAVTAELAAGKGLDVSVYDLRPVNDSGGGRWTDKLLGLLPGQANGSYNYRAVELRSFHVGLDRDGRMLVLKLTTPERVSAGSCSDPNILLLKPDPQDVDDQTGVEAETLGFKFLGARSDKKFTPYRLSGDGYIASDLSGICQNTWRTDGLNLTQIGDNYSGFTFAFHKYEIPWFLLGLTVLSVVIVHALSERYWMENRVDSVLVGLVQYLLVVRALIGVRGVFLDTAADLSDVCFDAGAAIVSLPLLFVLMRPIRPGGWKIETACAGWVVVVAAWLRWWGGDFPKVYAAIFLLPLLAVAVRMAWRLPAVRGTIMTTGDKLAALVRNRDPFFLGCVILGLAVVVRLGLLLLHVKEHLGPVSVSIPYLLCLIFGFALVIDGGVQTPKLINGMTFAFLFLLTIVAVPVLVSDNGVALTVITPFAAVALWQVWRHNHTFTRHMLWLIPWPIYVLALGGLLGLVLMHRPPDTCPADTADVGCLRDALDYAQAMNSKNLIRIMALFTPDRVPLIGTRDAMDSAMQVLYLHTYGGYFLGQGYLANITDWGNLRDVQFSDNLSAIHILYPFGRSAAIGLLAVMFVAVISVLKTPLPDGEKAWRDVAAQLSLWTFFGTGAYMVLANLLLVPFTGRNLYLLAVTSVSDIFEGTALLVIAYWALSARKEAGDGR